MVSPASKTSVKDTGSLTRNRNIIQNITMLLGCCLSLTLQESSASDTSPQRPSPTELPAMKQERMAGVTQTEKVIERGVALRKVSQQSKRDGLRTVHLIVQCLPPRFTPINIICGQSSVLLCKIQQVFFYICYGQVLNQDIGIHKYINNRPIILKRLWFGGRNQNKKDFNKV